MTKDEAMLQLRDQLKKLMSFTAEPVAETPVEPVMTEDVKCTAVKLKDGSEIMVPESTDLGVGVDVYAVDADGNQTPLGDDTYELEDGRTIIVLSGKVDTISDAPAGDKTPTEDANVTPEAMVVVPEQTGEEVAEGESPIEDRITALENHISQILELLQGMGNAQEMAMSKINEIGSQPATKSIKLGNVVESKFNSAKSEMDQLKELRKQFNLGGSGYNFTAGNQK